VEEALEDIKTLLVVALLEKQDLPLTLVEMSNSLMFITESAGNQAICTVECVKAEKENCLFSKFLLGATMQDGGIRERRNN